MPRGLLLPGLGVPLKNYEACTDILVYSFADDLMLPFEMVDTVLLVRESPPALGAHKSIFFSTLVL